ncbi:hypothetical protein CERSUDRAFT_33216, partial [Gelatoporia subvermispora B]
LLWIFHADHPDLFRHFVRVSPSVFDAILEKIITNPIFYNESNNAQLEVRSQLAIFLRRMGHYGNAISVVDLAVWAGVSTGSVNNYTHRVAAAITALHREAIHLPTDDERAAAKQFVYSKTQCTAWTGGIMAVDGTAIKLFEEPALYGKSWYNKNSDYAMSLQVVFMVGSLRVVDYAIGNVGSAHDSRAFKDTAIYQHPRLFLKDNEWIFGDSAYPLETWCIVPFK